jgi:hypothetical protein
METRQVPEGKSQSFDAGIKFLVRLNEYETEHGVFVIGHRFVPFRGAEVLIDDLRFETAGGEQLKPRIMGIALEQAFQYFSIFGEQNMANRLVNEDKSNKSILESGKDPASTIIRVRVIDLDSIPGGKPLSLGDYLLVTKLDEEGKRFKFESLPQTNLDPALKEPWRKALEDAFRKAFHEVFPTSDPTYLIRQAYLRVIPESLSNPGGAFSEFYNDNDVLEKVDWYGIPILWEKGTSSKNLDALFSKNPDSIGEEFSELFDEDMSMEDKFSRMAADLDLSVDIDDIQAFLLDEIGKMTSFHFDENDMDSFEKMRISVTARALDRVFVGVRLTGISGTKMHALYEAGAEAADELFGEIDPGLCRNKEVNEIRSVLLQIYEKFLLWMRVIREKADRFSTSRGRSLPEYLEDMNELVGFIYSLNDPDMPDMDTVKRFQSDDGAEYRRISSSFHELSAIWSTRIDARDIPKSGRVSTREVLEKQGYSASKDLYELKISIDDTKPAIYRLLSIPGNRTLADLHLCIQDAFGWKNYHLHEFALDGTIFGEPSVDDERPIVWDDIVSIDDLRLKKGEDLIYTYDLGDDWIHTVKIRSKGKLAGEAAWTTLCTCVDGARSGPPEDCGGTSGLEELVECFAAPLAARTKEQQEFITWAGRWKPDKFDIEAVNKKLSKR